MDNDRRDYTTLITTISTIDKKLDEAIHKFDSFAENCVHTRIDTNRAISKLETDMKTQLAVIKTKQSFISGIFGLIGGAIAVMTSVLLRK